MNVIRIAKRGRIKNINLEIPKLESNQILIENLYSPINPSDYYSFFNKYIHANNNLGFEGAGKIIGIGNSLDNNLIGKYCLNLNLNNNQGAYNKFSISKLNNSIILDNIDYNDLPLISNFLINPLTVYSLLKYSKNKKVIATAINSNLGNFLSYKCKKLEIKLIGLLRNKNKFENFEIYKLLEYDDDIEKFINELQPDLFLDCLSGNNFSKIYNLLPINSLSIIYGTITSPEITIKSTDLMINKNIKGFHLKNEIKEIKNYKKELLDDFYDYKKFISKPKIINIEDINKIIPNFRNEKNKIILKIN